MNIKQIRYAKNVLIWVTLIVGALTLKWNVYAETKAIYSENGNIIFKTTDTKATTGTRWRTVGFTIRRDKSEGNPVKNDKYAVLEMKSSYSTKKLNGDGTYTQTFAIPRKDVETKLIDSDIAESNGEEVLYLNGIFQVNREGVMDKGWYRTLGGIKEAANWRNKKDFEEFFDIKVSYKINEYPVYVEYRTSKNVVISTEKLSKVQGGKKVSVDLDTKKSFQGEQYKLYRSYVLYLAKPTKKVSNRKLSTGSSIEQVKSRQATQKVEGVKFVAMMKTTKNPSSGSEGTESENQMEEELADEVESEGIIAADERGNEKYQVEDGIPSSENLYINVFSPEYIVNYRFVRKEGKKTYPIRVSRSYTLRWSERVDVIDKKTNEKEVKIINHQESEKITKTVKVERDYSYWYVDTFNLYVPSKAVVTNEAFPNNSVTMKANNPFTPQIIYEKPGGTKSYIKEPEYQESLELSNVTIDGNGSRPSVPSEDFSSYANGAVGEIKVRNDKFVFDHLIIMSDAFTNTKTRKPIPVPLGENMVEKDILYAKGLTIDKNKQNGTYFSEGFIEYKAIKQINSDYDIYQTYQLQEVNEIVVHTPTVCNASIENKYRLCQMINPNPNYASLVLDTTFRISLPTEGQHRSIKGYYYNDYRRFIDKRQVKFPFDVYLSGKYYSKNHWIDLSDETEFYLPIWVEEGRYEIEFRSISMNAVANHKIESTEVQCNENLENYVATDTIPVEVSGRLYDFRINDISDYPIWQPVFREDHSLKMKGFHFGIDQLPLLRGSHPKFKNIGIMKLGYTIRMSLVTIGNMDTNQDFIHIKPKLYFMNKDGTNRREVDAYYTETISGEFKRLIQVGSDRDKNNVKLLKLGDNYLGIAKEELTKTSLIKKIDFMELKDTYHKVYCFSNIMVPSGMQTLIGAEYTGFKGISMPNLVISEQASKGMQRWYFEYYLPSDLHFAPKGFDLLSYARRHNIDYSEDFWLEDGYLILNYEIESIKKGSRHLSYINKDNVKKGYCGMWRLEGYLSDKVDSLGVKYCFEEGDLCMFDVNKSAAVDYRAGGTH